MYSKLSSLLVLSITVAGSGNSKLESLLYTSEKVSNAGEAVRKQQLSKLCATL
jgi:hypothetical protein